MFLRQVLNALVLGAAVTVSSCVLFPHDEFKSQHERELIGSSYAATVGARAEFQEVVSTSPTGTKVIKVRSGRQCNIFYEVDNDKIIRAWDDEGKGCVITH